MSYLFTCSWTFAKFVKENDQFICSAQCEKAFQGLILKAILQNAFVLSAPDVPFNLAVDASDVPAGAVLLQVGKDGIGHPVGNLSE